MFPAFPLQCVQENQPCSKGVYKSCCKPLKCEKDTSGKGYVCSSKKAPPKPSPIITTTPTPIITTTVSSHIHNPHPDQQVTPDGCTDDEIPGPPKPLDPKPAVTSPATPTKQEGLCKIPENSKPFYDPPAHPNCFNCTLEDPVCCDGQYCDLKEGLCESCSSRLKDECRSKPEKGSDCCTSSLACLISQRGAETGTCEATQCASHGRYVCDSDYNCCRENTSDGPTRFECRYYTNITGEESYFCRKCAKPGECCRSSRDCCESPKGFACFNNICDFSKEELPEDSTGIPEE
ncbi:unnamed protein product [Allacma fusca]|uniref:Uncharacterized protein n=1 Tax=Allacma fusca TaxID=39272 RepID=A0A8J2L179_9HEXA|nr:unnamed protein product [Allacma fusca]